jgi:hypothetical protein
VLELSWLRSAHFASIDFRKLLIRPYNPYKDRRWLRSSRFLRCPRNSSGRRNPTKIDGGFVRRVFCVAHEARHAAETLQRSTVASFVAFLSLDKYPSFWMSVSKSHYLKPNGRWVRSSRFSRQTNVRDFRYPSSRPTAYYPRNLSGLPHIGNIGHQRPPPYVILYVRRVSIRTNGNNSENESM